MRRVTEIHKQRFRCEVISGLFMYRAKPTESDTKNKKEFSNDDDENEFSYLEERRRATKIKEMEVI